MKELILASIIQPIIIFFYWASCVLIGWCIYQFTTRRLNFNRTIAGVTDNIFLKPIIWFASFVSVAALFSLILYIFKLPAIYFTGFYVALLGVSVYCLIHALWRRRRVVYEFKVGGVLFWTKVSIAVLIVSILTSDYIISTLLGTMFAGGADTYVHLAKIAGLLHYGFVIDDSILNGVVESRYHVNVIHSLYVPIAQLGHLSPATAWDLSNAFFRLIQWLGGAGLAYFVFRSWLNTSKIKSTLISIGALALGFAIPPAYMFVAVYPSKVVSLWLLLFVIGLSVMGSRFKEGAYLALTGAILIAFTQPTYALMAILFLLLYVLAVEVAGYLQTSQLDRRLLYIGLALMTVLSVTPLITGVFPQRLSSEALAIGSIPVIQMLGVDIVRPIWPTTLPPIILSIVAFIGYVYLAIRLVKQRRVTTSILAILLPSFFFLIACNPLFMALAHNKLPLWLVGRFTAMNVLQSISLTVGIYVVCYLIYRYAPMRSLNKKVAILCLLTVGLMFTLINALGVYKDFYKNTIAINNDNNTRLERVRTELSNVVEPGALAVTTLNDGYHLPSAIPIKVVAIDGTHATPTADSENRESCLERIFAKNLDEEDIDIVGAKYVIIPRWYEKLDEVTASFARSDKFSLLKESTDYLVYVVKYNKPNLSGDIRSNPCYLYQINENGRLY